MLSVNERIKRNVNSYEFLSLLHAGVSEESAVVYGRIDDGKACR
jgi:hypothetical protein